MKYFFTVVFVTLISFLTSYPLVAQVSIGGVPTGWGLSTERISEKIMPPINKEALLAEDLIEESMGLPFRFGAPHEVSINFLNSAHKEILPDKTVLYRLRIVSPDAFTLNLIYSNFYLPEGGKFFIYSENREELIGAFTSKNNKEDGLFATGLIRGDRIILEYQVPENLVDKSQIVISSVVHGYKFIN